MTPRGGDRRGEDAPTCGGGAAAGFPAGSKWEGSRDAPEETKYVIVNADEGDPGAFMDRALLEGNPHAVLEGMIIGGLRHRRARRLHLRPPRVPPGGGERDPRHRAGRGTAVCWAENILGSGFDFDVKVHQGAGAFVCGESTALMASLEGQAGEPRPKYIRSNVKGLWDRPSDLNNVETWANVPLIINRGADWFAQYRHREQQGHQDLLPGRARSTTPAWWKCPWA